eukprot:3942563-Pyramimonas_sp.AAC.1
MKEKDGGMLAAMSDVAKTNLKKEALASPITPLDRTIKPACEELRSEIAAHSHLMPLPRLDRLCLLLLELIL